MPNSDKDHESRLTNLEENLEILKKVLGVFAGGLDRVSRTQANQTDVIEELLAANETQAHYLKRLVENSEQNSELLKRLLEKKED